MHDLLFPLPAISWFITIASCAALAWALGVVIGRSHLIASRAALLASVVVLLAWGYLMRHQDVAVQILPTQLLSRIEGVAAVPVFMLIVGIAWSRASMSRQRHVACCAMVIGALFFYQGGGWMIQPTPAMGTSRMMDNGMVMQSEDYSCVAAAAATALNRIGVPTTEAEMVRLTDTRPGRGATTLRAMAAMEQKLRGTGMRVALIAADFNALQLINPPALTPLQFEKSRLHMVTILDVNPVGLTIADPTEGLIFMERGEFESVYRGQVVVIRRD